MEITLFKKSIYLSPFHPLNQETPDPDRLGDLARVAKKWKEISFYRDENNNLVITPK